MLRVIPIRHVHIYIHTYVHAYIRIGAEMVLVRAIIAEDTLSVIVVVEKAIVVVSFVRALYCVMLLAVTVLSVVVKTAVESEK